MNKLPVIVIVGPTAVGKSALALELAKTINAEIISADSRQIYRYMDIGTAKPTQDALQQIKHHFVNYLEPNQKYTAGDFSADTRKLIAELRIKNKNIIVVGGSGMYIRALLSGIIEPIDINEKIRIKLASRLKTDGLGKLFAELKQSDPVLADRLSSNDKQRILRGLEVFLSSGQKLSDLQKGKQSPANFPYMQIGLTMQRSTLYERINSRVDEMLSSGLLEEVKNILDLGYEECNALNSVGYKEIIRFLKNEIDLKNAVHLIKQNSRRYAKRQITWFKKDDTIEWFDAMDKNLFFNVRTFLYSNNK